VTWEINGHTPIPIGKAVSDGTPRILAERQAMNEHDREAGSSILVGKAITCLHRRFHAAPAAI
jgi:hypothetical protein